MSDEIKRHPYFTNCVVRFEGYEGDTAKLKPQGVKRSDKVLRARAELGMGLSYGRRRSFLDRFRPIKGWSAEPRTYPAANRIVQQEAANRVAWPPAGPNDIHDERERKVAK